MFQVLFRIPIRTEMSPDGIPVYAYGFMLFICFIFGVWFTSRRAKQLGIPLSREKTQDMAIFLFVAGIAGARIVYMWQFHVPWYKFFRIWEGGIVLYGGIIGGALAFILFHRYVLRRFGVTLWQMGDLAAPSLAMGIALGRIGCLLNGCCWGNVANESCPAIEFPLLTAPAREMLVERDGLQTAAGFSSTRDLTNLADVRTVINRVEPGSAAEQAGLKPGDKLTRFRIADAWIPNGQVLMVTGTPSDVLPLEEKLREFGTVTTIDQEQSDQAAIKVTITDPNKAAAVAAVAGRFLNREIQRDSFTEMLNSWPRGRNSVQLAVERDGVEIELPAFTPRGIGLHPTQIYESISMVLIFVVLIAYYPFRRHDGQVWVLFMILYSIHRFLNEILRTEPVEGLKMTLSQNISVGVVLVAIGLEIYLRRTLPRRL